TSPRTPQRVFFTSEEAEAVPAESVRLKWKPVKHDIWINFEKQPKTNGEDSSRKNLTDSTRYILLTSILFSCIIVSVVFVTRLIRRRSSAGESARFIPVRSWVQIPPPLFINIPFLKGMFF